MTIDKLEYIVYRYRNDNALPTRSNSSDTQLSVAPCPNPVDGFTELSERVGITMANLSILRTGKAKAVRFTTLEAICVTLECQPGDLLSFEE